MTNPHEPVSSGDSRDPPSISRIERKRDEVRAIDAAAHQREDERQSVSRACARPASQWAGRNAR
jgi:hypothetical protein